MTISPELEADVLRVRGQLAAFVRHALHAIAESVLRTILVDAVRDVIAAQVSEATPP